MQQKRFDTTHPYNLGNSLFTLRVRILHPYVKQVGAVEVWGKAVRIRMQTPRGVELIPNRTNQIGIWRKGSPPDVVFEGMPHELKIIELSKIEWIMVEVSSI